MGHYKQIVLAIGGRVGQNGHVQSGTSERCKRSLAPKPNTVKRDTMSSLPLSWQKILHDAIHTPGTIHTAYTRFHSFSLGNQLLALFQCTARNIQPGPIGTFMHWKQCGRFVKKGSKAI